MVHSKLLILGGLLVAGLVNLLLPQYIIAAREWWRTFREDNFDQPDVEEIVDDALGLRRRDTSVWGYRLGGVFLIGLAILLWFTKW